MALTTEDLLEIQGLAARYNHAIDGGDAEAYVATFTEDGVLDAGRQLTEGRTALKELALGFANSPGSPRHVLTNLVIDGDGDQATLKAYLHMYALVGEPAQQTVVVGGVYNDTLKKEDGRWKFVRRTFTADR